MKNIAGQEMTESATLALKTILHQPTRGIPTGTLIHVMEHAQIERLAGAEPGSYVRDPDTTYIAMQRALGVCLLDQYLAHNPLRMDHEGYKGKAGEGRTATTGADVIECDGILIDSAEAVVEHMERFLLPALERRIAEFDAEARVREIIARERKIQEMIGPAILKTMHGAVDFPGLHYGTYGYVHYFTAYALYPEVMERSFSIQADLAALNNRAVARAYREAGLPPLCRLDHDIADSRGTLADEKTLDRIWLPHFARALEPLLETNLQMIWHCDGNLMAMVPRLLDVGLHGFQGFQYEDGMDYAKICRMKTRNGDGLIIMAGVSVTRTLPMGAPADVKKELRWLVDNGPQTGLLLCASSSITPGVPAANLDALAEGLEHYRLEGRSG